jgi:hypothetical protein
MRKLRVRINPLWGGSNTYWDKAKNKKSEEFRSKDNYIPQEICLAKNNHLPMAACHELSHILIADRFKLKETFLYHDDLRRISQQIALKTFCNELTAWRLAKSFCKPRYWDERRAVRCVKSYAGAFSRLLKIHWNKLRICPLCIPKLEKKLERLLSNLKIDVEKSPTKREAHRLQVAYLEGDLLTIKKLSSKKESIDIRKFISQSPNQEA